MSTCFIKAGGIFIETSFRAGVSNGLYPVSNGLTGWNSSVTLAYLLILAYWT